MPRIPAGGSLVSAALLTSTLIACSDQASQANNRPAVPSPQTEHRGGGDTSLAINTASSFEKPAANLTDASALRDFNLGNDFFKNPWVPNRASTSLRDGLGPHFNNNACQDCHIRDGKGHAPAWAEGGQAPNDGTDFGSLLIRTYKSEITANTRAEMRAGKLINQGDSTVGGQLQHHANPDISPEVALRVSYTYSELTLNGGEVVQLRRPHWHITSLYTGYPLDADTLLSPRLSPAMIGLGLLERISEADLLAREDAEDRNGDGISGRANRVWSLESQTVTLGRFGWKAGQPSVLEQTAGAFAGDMGLTSRLHPDEGCLAHQADCLAAPTGNGDSTESYPYEVADAVLDKVAFYAAHLAVPERRAAKDAQVQRGKQVFWDAGCEACHRESYLTPPDPSAPALANQRIYPYTDLLLHDMGDDLADVTQANESAPQGILAEYSASAQEWRTPPLWGIGLVKRVDPTASFLHDGRAQTLLEAIVWHGGEAAAARDRVINLAPSDRAALLAFLQDL